MPYISKEGKAIIKRSKLTNISKWPIYACVSILLAFLYTIHQIGFSIVNILYWDQWDFLEPLINGDGPLTSFMRQHGPHRQGLGNSAIALIFAASAWSIPAVTWVTLAVLAIAAFLLTNIAAKDAGQRLIAILLVPIACLNPNIYETVTMITNPAHSAIPFLLCAIYAWSISYREGRYFLGIGTTVAALGVFTGFGIFLGFVHGGFLILNIVTLMLHKNRLDAVRTTVAFMVMLMAFLLFFIDYAFMPASPCFDEALSLKKYLAFFGRYSLRTLSLLGKTSTMAAIYALLALSIYLFVSYRFAHDFLARSGRRSAGLWKNKFALPWLLISISVLFGINAAAGRTCLGYAVGGASKYILFSSLFLIGTLILTNRLSTGPVRKLLLTICMVSMLGGVYMPRFDKENIRQVTAGKQKWIDCLLGAHLVDDCYAITGFEIYPAHGRDLIEPKLEYLRKNRLTLYHPSKTLP